MPNYADSFYSAVSVLCGHGNIKQRLVTAYLDNLDQIDEDDLPIAVKQSFIDLRALVSRVAPLNGEGAIRASVRKMSVTEADECARMIVDLYAQILPYADQEDSTVPLPTGDRMTVPPFLVKTN